VPGWNTRLYRRIRIAKGVTLNVSKSGPSVSLGRRGLKMTLGPRGLRRTVGLPGSGLFLTKQEPVVASDERARQGSRPTSPAPAGSSSLRTFLIGSLIAAGVMLLIGYRPWDSDAVAGGGLATWIAGSVGVGIALVLIRRGIL
jgi:hypothetical protein